MDYFADLSLFENLMRSDKKNVTCFNEGCVVIRTVAPQKIKHGKMRGFGKGYSFRFSNFDMDDEENSDISELMDKVMGMNTMKFGPFFESFEKQFEEMNKLAKLLRKKSRKHKRVKKEKKEEEDEKE